MEPIELEEADRVSDNFHSDPYIIDRSIATWRRAKPGTGNVEFFKLGIRLKRAGLSRHQIRFLLTAEAAHARSPKERLAQIGKIIKSSL